MRRLALTVALTMIAPISAQATTTERFTFSNGGALAIGSSSNSCQVMQVFLTVARNGTHNLTAPSTTPLVLATVVVFDYCANTFVAEVGSTSSFQLQLVAPGAPNTMPQSLTASGTIPMSCDAGPCDSLTFSMALQLRGTDTQHTVDTNDTTITSSFTGVPVSTRTVQHSDLNTGDAAGPITVSTLNFGTLSLSWSQSLSDFKSHTVQITY